MASKRLKYIGDGEAYFPGVPQSELSVVDEPQAHGEVSEKQADELIQSGLYAPVEEG